MDDYLFGDIADYGVGDFDFNSGNSYFDNSDWFLGTPESSGFFDTDFSDPNTYFDYSYDTNWADIFSPNDSSVPFFDLNFSDPNLIFGTDPSEHDFSTGSFFDNQNWFTPEMSESSLGDVMISPNGSSAISNAASALNKILGTVGSAARSPLGQMAQALLGYAAKQKSISNQRKVRDTAAQIARAESQRGLAPNRTGLVNMDTAVKDPMSYVQPAPPIQR